MNEVFEILKNVFNPEYLIEHGGLYILLIIVFAETGLFFGFFLPGDSLLFTAGLLCATGVLDVSIYTLIASICFAAILGNIVGYLFGWKVGQRLYERKESWVFKRKYLYMTENFYQRYGGTALIIARFLPIVRTFAPILAGIIKMDWKRFALFNIIGSILWVFSFVFVGFILGKIFPEIGNYLHWIIIGLVIVTMIPVLRTILRERKTLQKKMEEKILGKEKKKESENVS